MDFCTFFFFFWNIETTFVKQVTKSFMTNFRMTLDLCHRRKVPSYYQLYSLFLFSFLSGILISTDNIDLQYYSRDILYLCHPPILFSFFPRRVQSLNSLGRLLCRSVSREAHLLWYFPVVTGVEVGGLRSRGVEDLICVFAISWPHPVPVSGWRDPTTPVPFLNLKITINSPLGNFWNKTKWNLK